MDLTPWGALPSAPAAQGSSLLPEPAGEHVAEHSCPQRCLGAPGQLRR